MFSSIKDLYNLLFYKFCSDCAICEFCSGNLFVVSMSGKLICSFWETETLAFKDHFEEIRDHFEGIRWWSYFPENPKAMKSSLCTVSRDQIRRNSRQKFRIVFPHTFQTPKPPQIQLSTTNIFCFGFCLLPDLPDLLPMWFQWFLCGRIKKTEIPSFPIVSCGVLAFCLGRTWIVPGVGAWPTCALGHCETKWIVTPCLFCGNEI